MVPRKSRDVNIVKKKSFFSLSILEITRDRSLMSFIGIVSIDFDPDIDIQRYYYTTVMIMVTRRVMFG